MVSSVENGGTGYRSDLAVNVPIIEGKLGLRAVASFNQEPGWVDMPNAAGGNGANGLGLNDIKDQAGLDAFTGNGASTKDVNEGRLNTIRLKLKAQPTEELYLEGTVSRARSRFGGGANGYAVGLTRATLPEPTQNSIDTYSFEVGYSEAGARKSLPRRSISRTTRQLLSPISSKTMK